MSKETAGQWTRDLTSLSAGPGTGSLSLSLHLIMNHLTLINCWARLIVRAEVAKRIADAEGETRESSKYTRYQCNPNYLNCLLTVYLTTLPRAQNRYRQMMGLFVNNELERIWKEVAVPRFEDCRDNVLEQLGETTKNVGSCMRSLR
jgi:hypothetical protein